MVQGRLAHFLYSEYRNFFLSEMETLLNLSYWNVTEILTWATELTELAVAHGAGYDYGSDTDSFPVSDYEDELVIISNWISSRRDILLDELLPTPVDWEMDWHPNHYTWWCLGDNAEGPNCIEMQTSMYMSEDICRDENGQPFYVRPDTIAWAKNCDEIKQAYL